MSYHGPSRRCCLLLAFASSTATPINLRERRYVLRFESKCRVVPGGRSTGSLGGMPSVAECRKLATRRPRPRNEMSPPFDFELNQCTTVTRPLHRSGRSVRVRRALATPRRGR
jgi:hypothetical protein